MLSSPSIGVYITCEKVSGAMAVSHGHYPETREEHRLDLQEELRWDNVFARLDADQFTPRRAGNGSSYDGRTGAYAMHVWCWTSSYERNPRRSDREGPSRLSGRPCRDALPPRLEALRAR